MSTAHKKFLKFEKAARDYKTFIPNFFSGIDKAHLMVLGMIPATDEEIKDAHRVLNELFEQSDAVERKEQKRLAKKMAKKSKVVRGGRP